MLPLRHLLAALVIPVLIPVLVPLENPAIVIRHDRPDSAYVALGSRYADILAHVEERAEGTVLAPRWVLTAAHVVESLGPFDAPWVTIGGSRYDVEKILIHPDWEGGWDDFLSNHDLALLKLERPVPQVRPVRLYRGDEEHGMVVTLLGRGKTGTGVTGQVGEKGMTVRGATNRIDGVSETALLMTFDIGEDDSTELEAGAGAGDSGGPALLARGDTIFIVGVSSAGTGAKGYGMYGTLDIYTRVSGLADWIEETMATDPALPIRWERPTRASSEAPRWPATSVGDLAASFFATYASSLDDPQGDDWVRFYQRHGDSERPAEDRAAAVRQGLVDSLGRLEIYGWSTAGPNRIRVLVYAPENDTWRSIGLETSPESPGKLTRLYMKWESPPKSEVWGR